MRSETSTRPEASTCINPRAHWPTGQWGLGERMHDGMGTVSGPLRGPSGGWHTFPRPHEAYGLCALGLPQVKASGLGVVSDHPTPVRVPGVEGGDAKRAAPWGESLLGF